MSDQSRELSKAIGRVIRDRRNALGLTPTALAVRADTNVCNVSLYENGSRLPNLAILQRIAWSLDFDLSALLEEAEHVADEREAAE